MMENPVSSMVSKLPNDIARQILCFIDPTNREAIELGLVSKDFCRVFRNRPALVLDRESTSGLDSAAERRKRYVGELNYILTTLEKYSDNLESFEFSPLIGAADEEIHNRCIDLAIEKGVQKLDLNMMDSYLLPQSVFDVESLVRLSMSDCWLKPETRRMISWPKLTSLHLQSVEMVDEVFESMIRGSPLLQVLEINQCCQNSPSFDFRVSDLRCLKKLKVSLCKSQTLHLSNVARNLESLDCRFCQLDIGNSEYASLKVLHLSFVTTTDNKFFTNFERKFPHLEELCIQKHSNLPMIKVCSQSLKKLELVAGGELQEACLELPNIEVFNFTNSSWADTSISIPRLSFVGNSRGWTSHIRLVESSVYDSWFMELNHFLAALNGSQTWIDIQLGEMGKSMEDDTEIIDDAVSFSGMIREPYKKTTGTTFTVSSAILIEGGVIWNCTPETLTFQNWCDFQSLMFKEMEWIQEEDLDDETVEPEYEDEDLDGEMAESEVEDKDLDHYTDEVF